VVVLAGEDRNDRASLRILLEEFCPQMRGRIVELNDAPKLRDARTSRLPERVDALARLVRARAARESADIACVFVQEDLDQVDGDVYLATRERVQIALDKAFLSAHYVLSVWELEAWLLLFPDALSSLVSGWDVPRQIRNTDTGRMADPKSVLKHVVSGSSNRRYRESDAPDVFQKAVLLGLLGQPSGTNRSWTRFREDAGEYCRDHVGRK
jgi:hypothetical protein